MRTTIRLDGDLLRQAKRRAAEAGTSLNAVIEDAVRAALVRSAGAARAPALPCSRVARGGLQPGVDLDDSAALLDLMDGRR
jgi:hypothetical protein